VIVVMADILAFVDLHEATIPVVRMAKEIAAALHGRLILMHISNPGAAAEDGKLRANDSRQAVALEMQEYHSRLQSLAKACTESGVETSSLLVRGRSSRGNPVPRMVRELKRIKPALIIMGTHQHGRLFEAIFGSASSKIVQNARCPILLVPCPNRARGQRPNSGDFIPRRKSV
jgi:nucleotide-binding universal stress UspA family protein